MTDKTKHTVIFLPWIKLDKVYKYDDVTFIPWPKIFKEIVKDTILFAQVKKIFSSYFNLNEKKPIKELTITTICEDPLSRTNYDKFENIINSTKILAFCSIEQNDYFKNNNYVNISTFEVICQNFIYNDYYTNLVSRRRDGRTNLSGYEFDEIKVYSKPWVAQCNSFQINLRLLEALNNCKKNKKVFKIINNAIQWFLLSMTDNPEFTQEIELASIYTSFQYLFARKVFKKDIYNLFEKNNNINNYNCPKSIWYADFTNYRNKILHGIKKIKSEFNIYEHNFIGTIIFIASIKRMLSINSFYELIDKDFIIEKAIDLVVINHNIKNYPQYLIEARWNYAEENALKSLNQP